MDAQHAAAAIIIARAGAAIFLSACITDGAAVAIFLSVNAFCACERDIVSEARAVFLRPCSARFFGGRSGRSELVAILDVAAGK